MRILPQGLLSRLYGAFNRRRSSAAKIPGFIESLGIDVEEAELPVAEYRSLDEFFCRRLKPSARPIDRTPHRFVCPADGRTFVFPKIEGEEFRIKGCSVRLDDLWGDREEAAELLGGVAVIVRLAPCDYHRFHFPDSGIASETRVVPGRLHSVHPFALENNAPSFKNKRTITYLESDNFGRVVLIEVGAFAVGTIAQTYRPGRVERGGEKGCFRFGGSTVVMLIQKHHLQLDQDLVSASAQGMETFIKMGSSIGTAVSS
jgi:phosphatidylserine decarboxylase